MARKPTILDVCASVLEQKRQPMTAEELYEEILRRNLYEFKAKSPLNVLRSTLREHVRGSDQRRIVEEPGRRYRVV
jgi:restriction system protein